jgi:putative ABC transport system permease protein
VTEAGLISRVPLRDDNVTTTLLFENNPSVPMSRRPDAGIRIVSPGYFRAMGIPLRAGRDFTQRDLTKDPTVVIVNEALVRRFFPDQEALAKHISRERRPPSWLEIIGVVGDTRQFGLASPAMPELYQPAAWGRLILVVQATVDPAGLVTPLRREVAAMDRDLPLYSVQTMEDAVTHSSARMRSITALLGVFAGIALALAAIGVYGLVSFSLSRRQHEIGIRLALGATRGNVIVMALRDSMKLIAAGLLLGLMGAFALTRYVASLLFGVNPVDPVTFFAVPLFLAAVALAASYIPALQATAIDPAAALRHE